MVAWKGRSKTIGLVGLTPAAGFCALGRYAKQAVREAFWWMLDCSQDTTSQNILFF